MPSSRCPRWRALLVLVLCATLSATVYAAPPAQGTDTIHVVQAGETLFAIAQRYGATVDAVVAANGLSDPNRIVVGQRLLIPVIGTQAQELYTVQAGDTLAMIARRTGVSIHNLAQINRLANPSLIYVGQRLLVPPDGSESESSERTLDSNSSTAAEPEGGQVYVVQPNDTLARIAARYDVSVWVLAQFNEIANPSVIHAGQSLLIPTADNPTHLPPPFLALEVTPVVAVQGRTVQVWIETDGAASLSGQYDGRDLVFAERGGPGLYGTLIAVPAMASPGPYLFEVKAVQGERQTSVRSMLDVRAGSFGFQTILLSAEKAALLDPELVTQESQLVQEATAQATFPGLWQERFAVPLAGAPSVSAPFGGRRSYNDGPAVSYHSGVDYSVGAGTPVLCPALGRVVLAEALQVRGNAVILDHGRGVMSGYWHLSQIQVSEGELVERGEVLGLVGSTGLSTGAHLHWEMRIMGIPVDPVQWVREDIR